MAERRTAHVCTSTCGHAVIGDMLDEWQALRLVLAELERAEHPDITDVQGRVWTWWEGDLYRTEGRRAWPRALIDEHPAVPDPTAMTTIRPRQEYL